MSFPGQSTAAARSSSTKAARTGGCSVVNVIRRKKQIHSSKLLQSGCDTARCLWLLEQEPFAAQGKLHRLPWRFLLQAPRSRRTGLCWRAGDGCGEPLALRRRPRRNSAPRKVPPWPARAGPLEQFSLNKLTIPGKLLSRPCLYTRTVLFKDFHNRTLISFLRMLKVTAGFILFRFIYLLTG